LVRGTYRDARNTRQGKKFALCDKIQSEEPSVKVEQIRPRLWRWTASHPDWTPEAGGDEGWEPEVSSYALVEEDELVLIDPLVPADDEERFWRALDDDVEHHGPPQILLTVFWHTRSAPTIAERYDGARVFAPAAKAEEARERVPAVATYELGETLPGGIEAKGTEHRGEAVLWIPAHRALAAGDLLLGTEDGGVRVVPDSWLRPGVTGEMIRDGLRPLLDLPVEVLLLTHGGPVLGDAQAKLEVALR
jgi:glyoxylase-like metal-dependent hydrolase (beta-lactamase superfamily II)